MGGICSSQHYKVWPCAPEKNILCNCAGVSEHYYYLRMCLRCRFIFSRPGVGLRFCRSNKLPPRCADNYRSSSTPHTPPHTPGAARPYPAVSWSHDSRDQKSGRNSNGQHVRLMRLPSSHGHSPSRSEPLGSTMNLDP